MTTDEQIDVAILEKLYYNIFSMMVNVHWDYFHNPNFDNWVKFHILEIELEEVKNLIRYMII